MKFNLIRAECEKTFKERLKRLQEKIKTEEGLNYVVRWNLKRKENYKGTFGEQQKKTLKAIKRKIEKELNKEINYIKSIEEAGSFKDLVVTIEWNKSQMWGSNPKPYTDKGFIGSSVRGCGFCKRSTALANALNSYKPLLRELYKKEEERLKKAPNTDRRDYIHYGSGHYYKPYFEGGVGVESLRGVIEAIGLKFKCVTDTPKTDVFIITK